MFSEFRNEPEKKRYLPIICSLYRKHEPFKSGNDISLSPSSLYCIFFLSKIGNIYRYTSAKGINVL